MSARYVPCKVNGVCWTSKPGFWLEGQPIRVGAVSLAEWVGAVQKERVFVLGQPRVEERAWFRPRFDSANPQPTIKTGAEWETKKGCPTFTTALF